MVTWIPPVVALVVVLAVIWYLGGGQFGRSQTQAWIDRVRRMPRLYGWLDRHHGKFRASVHYVEFGGLFLVLYWLGDAVLWGGEREPRMTFRWSLAGVAAAVSVVAAFLDEMHQLQSGTRQFRRVDFLHSCCGVTLAMGIVYIQSLARGLS